MRDNTYATVTLQMVLLLKEYLCSEDIEEVSLCKYFATKMNIYRFFPKWGSIKIHCCKTQEVFGVCKPAKCSANLKLFTVISFQASRCVQELEVPHFYHELVYEVYIYNELASSLAHDILNKSKIEITDLWTELICEKISYF